jgi:hypothetical protein
VETVDNVDNRARSSSRRTRRIAQPGSVKVRGCETGYREAHIGALGAELEPADNTCPKGLPETPLTKRPYKGSLRMPPSCSWRSAAQFFIRHEIVPLL